MVNVSLKMKTRVEMEVVLLPQNINSVHEPMCVMAVAMSSSLAKLSCHELTDQYVCMVADAAIMAGSRDEVVAVTQPHISGKHWKGEEARGKNKVTENGPIC